MAGILVATVLNHTLAVLAGQWVATLVEPHILNRVLAGIFFVFGLWILIPDKDEEIKEVGHWGAFLTTTIVFFMAEMGDKTQLATIALGANYSSAVLVTIGTTAGMLVADGLAVFLGKPLTQKIDMKWVRRFASLLFIIFGILILFSNQTLG